MAVAQAWFGGIGKYLLAMPVPLSHCILKVFKVQRCTIPHFRALEK